MNDFRKLPLTLAVATGLGLSSAALAQMDVENPSGVSGTLPTTSGTAIVLYDQTDSASGNGAPDQDFEAANDLYDAEGADDFIVPGGEQWSIQVVSTVGTQSSGGSAASVDITFYADNAGAPGAPVSGCDYPGLIPAESNGSFSITLPSACVLPPGTYWMGQQTRQDFATDGQHFWSNRTVQSNNPSHWRNPGDGFASGCTDWTPQTTCGVGGGTNPDFLFGLSGTTAAYAPAVSLSASSIDMGPVAPGGSSTSQLQVTNSGTGDLDISQVTSPAAPFSLTGGSCLPSTTLASGASCTIDIEYAPAAQAGSHTSSFDIVSNAASSPDTVTVRGSVALAVPTLGGWNLLALALAVFGFGWLTTRKT